MSTLGDKLRCPHCLEEIDNLENPKQLPCNHIYCSPCLETLTETVQTGVIITCSICGKEHHQHDLPGLMSPAECSKKDSHKTQPAEDSAAACDRCKDKKKTAVCYCVNCERKLCPIHEERHQDYFSDEDNKHKLITIQVYQKSSTLYKKAVCEEHGRELGMCCTNCYCLKCSKCHVYKDCTDAVHEFHTLEDMSKILREEFDVLMRKCSERITKMCKLEKETWQRLDELEEECKKLRKQVERKTESLIVTIHRESARLVRNISRFESRQRKEIEEYLSELREKRENYERDSAACADFIRDNHVVEIVKQRDEKIQSISPELACIQPVPNLSNADCMRDTVNGYLEFDVNLIPQAIELISSHDTDGFCAATCFTSEGRLLVGGRGVKLHTENYGEAKLTLPSVCTSISRARAMGDIKNFVLAYSTHNERVVKSTTDFVTWTEVFKYNHTGIGQIAAGSVYIAATMGQSLILYNMETKVKYTRTSNSLIHHPQFLSDDSLLVGHDGALSRYRITVDARLELMWTCDGLDFVHSLCITAGEMIVVTTKRASEKNLLHIVSTDGKLLKTLRHGEFVDNCSQMSIYDDVLAVAYWNMKKFKLFRLL